MTAARPGRLALYGLAAYVLWLRYGTSSNPPVAYDKFQSGLTFASVRELLGFEADSAYDRGEYMFVTRATVLGRWRELKLDQYNRYLDRYEEPGAFGERAREAGDVF